MSTPVFAVTITLQDAGSLATLQDVLVTVKNAGETTPYFQGRTDPDGHCATTLVAGAYHVLIAAPPGYNSPSAQVLDVVDDVSVIYALERFLPLAPRLPSLCRVYGFEYLNGSPVAGRAVSAKLVDLPKVSATVIFEGGDAETTTDGAGYWYLDLVRGLSYSFRIQEAGILRTVAVPDSGSVDLGTLL